MDVDLPRAVTSGFYPVERTKDATFVWTSPLATVTLRGIDRSNEWSCRTRLRAARPAEIPPAHVLIGVDGVTVGSHRPGDEYQDVAATLPVKPGSSSAALTISTTPPYKPATDPRELGVMVDEIRCTPAANAVKPPTAALVAASLAGAIFGALFSLAFSTVVPLAAAITLFSAGLALVLTTGVASYSRAYLDWVLPVALWTAGAAVTVGALVWRGRAPLDPAARFVLAFSATVLCLKTLALLHPSKEVVDALFQAHRLEWVLDGRYYFTQLMPGGVQFPYAIGLYVAAAPWAQMIQDHVALLRIVVLVAEAVAAAILYVAVVRAWGDRLAGAAAVVFYHAAPLSYVVIGNGNLTFAFGQSIAAIAMAIAIIWSTSERWRLAGVGLFALTALAFLSHVGVFPLVGVALVATGALYAGAGGVELRRAGRVIVGVSVLAALFAIGSYYAHFPEVYRGLRRVSTGEAVPSSAMATPTRPPVAPLSVSQRAGRAARIAVDAYGPWMLLLMPLGVAAISQRRTDRLTLALAGWGISLMVFLAFRVLAPVDAPLQRYADEFIHRVYGMTLPAVAIVTASAVAWAWRKNAAWRTAAALLSFGALAVGIVHWSAWFQ